MSNSIWSWLLPLVMSIIILGLSLPILFGERQLKPAVLVHDHGRMPIVFRQFCDGWPNNPTPLRCARVVWCWSHQREEAIDWPLADAIPFLKELEEASTW